ncbi:DsbA family protein [Plantibacter sp. CFBP 8804]|uniref:DsbA family protein n=1 Tax=Plantibacter sp. CFBP 8804 TaxID=2775270 RepID=UPI00177AD6DA|nr:thioredoxin domain-containing protein [Plantibacter sp. CFBP 8804]MBD8519127.1 thioredoxin domain-containing protein [Plantibacter sp. CFBP 8804]
MAFFQLSPRRRRGAVFLAALISAIILSGCVGSEAMPSEEEDSYPTSSLTGVVGAVEFDGGYISLGSGATVIDLYLDPLCPYCKIFEADSGQLLFDEVDDGRATLRIHPVALLDRLSVGTNYSTRAAASIVDVAASHPFALPGYLSAVFANQPAENTPGLSDQELVSIAGQLNVSLSDATTLRTYQAWVRDITAEALQGPLPTSEALALTAVPTTIVNGHLYSGNSDDAEHFAQFYQASLTQ